MSKFKVGDEVECCYEVWNAGFKEEGVVVNTTMPFPTRHPYTVKIKKDGKLARFSEEELTLINVDLENV